MNPFSHKAEHIYRWLVTGLSGVFMFISLYIYRVYHIDQVEAFTRNSMLVRAITHSVIVSLVFFLVEFLLAPRIKVNENIKPFITALLATFVGLNLTFLAFNYFYQWTELYWSSYFPFLYEYPLILIIPVSLSYLIHNLIKLRAKNSFDWIIFISENQKEHLKIKAKNLLYIKSAQNYIEIVHQNKAQVERRLIRKSLKQIIEDPSFSEILLMCHRSYLVNPHNIDQIIKSNGKLELTIKGETVPVTKKYESRFNT